jgi:myo-inositol-1(or 4)-monophosphatase
MSDGLPPAGFTNDVGPQDDLGFAADLAYRTGEFLREYYRPGGLPVHLKADRSVVTQADLDADHLIAETIRTAYPEDAILSEELHQFSPSSNRGSLWVIDPLDGTTNFSLGLHIWGVAIARLVNGFPRTAAIYFPLLHELYTGEINGGASLNGEPIHAEPPNRDKPAAFFACCGHTHRNYDVSVPYKPRILGSAAYNFCAVARGAAVLCFEARPKVWDLAAAWVLVTAAGGVIQVHHGSPPFPIRPGLDYTDLAFPCLAAATEKMVAKGLEMIRSKNLQEK